MKRNVFLVSVRIHLEVQVPATSNIDDDRATASEVGLRVANGLQIPPLDSCKIDEISVGDYPEWIREEEP